MLNQVNLIGFLGADPKITTSKDGVKIAHLSLATSTKWKDDAGNAKEATEWHRVTIFGKAAEFAEKYLGKGDKLFIDGRLKYSKYTDKEGVERYTTDIIVDLGGRMMSLESKGTTPPAMTDVPAEVRV